MSIANKKVITRFAPSPTGVLHVGGARTALFNYLYARQHEGNFLLRIEDTDKERSKKEYEENIINGLAWLGISYDKLYRQSERADKHKDCLQRLINRGLAYEAEEGKDGSGKVIRFRNPGAKISFHDAIRGNIEFDTTELGDFVVAKNIDTPLFHLAVVVDDFEMGVTQVIRGEDHISNTPRQILLQSAIDAPHPTYAHIPLILAHDKSKLSKRHGSVSLVEFRDKGYLPDAMVNFLALIGWHPEGSGELFSMNDLVKEFTLERVQKGGAIFNIEKLDWLNREYLKKMLPEEFEKKVIEYIPEKFKKSDKKISERMLKNIALIIVERINTLSDISAMFESGEFDYIFERPTYDPRKLLWKGTPDLLVTKQRLDKVIELLQEIDEENLTGDTVKETVWKYASSEGRGDVLWPMRFALSGKEKSPDPFVLVSILGKEESLKRLRYASETLIARNS